MRRGGPSEARLKELETQQLTYPEVGATAEARLPAGYRHVRWTARVGTGRARFDQAAEDLMSWEVHRDAGLRVTASAPTAQKGAVAVLEAGRPPLTIPAPCRVVYDLDGDRRRGFAYGTLPGHPEIGEAAFVVELAEDDAVTFAVTTFSRPSSWFYHLGSPIARLAQDGITRRYLRVLRAPESR
ncbi:MAG: DUF1990 family protein [Actinomycetes bacterium]